MSRVDRARRERHSRSLTSRVRRAAAGVASFVPGFPLRLARAGSLGAPLALLLAALALAAPAAAQTSVTLVSNNGQTFADANSGNFTHDRATSFTTGSHSTGYTLTGLTLYMRKTLATVSPSYSVTVNANDSGRPGTILATLSTTDSIPFSELTFGAIRFSGSVNLAANSTYWVVHDSNSFTDSRSTRISGTTSDNEDSGALPGWSIGDVQLRRTSDKTSVESWDSGITDTLRMNLVGYANDTTPPSAPTGLTVSAGTNSGELDVSWTAPSGPITDYDLRYYEGAADPTDAADWVEEHETDGLGTGDSTATSTTIKGLKASTAYRVQVRAGVNGAGEGAWSASVTGTTGSPPAANNAPKVMTQKAAGHGTNNACKLWTDTTQPAATNQAVAGRNVGIALKVRGTEDTEWPTRCSSGTVTVPVFDDRDAGDLYYTFSYTLPDNLRGFGGEAPFWLREDNIFAKAVAIGSNTDVRIDLTARDEHGASATAWVRFTVYGMANSVGAPAFSATVPDQTVVTGTAFSLALPGATGGDVSTSSDSAINSPYTYAVSGLPAGLSFDAATRRVSGTPTADGTFTVTYTADDADSSYSLKNSPQPADTADAASQTFTILVGALPSAPTGLAVSAGTNSGELDASWTAPSGTVTDYDLRYYEGAADPTDAADWVEEHETNGLGTADSTATSVTIKGLKANTAYRVQVRAGNAVGEGAWTASVAGTTNAASGTNNAPKAMTQKPLGHGTANSCELWTDTSQPAETIAAPAGSLTQLGLTTRGTEADVWPTTCTKSGAREAPVFDDRDGVGDLYFAMRYTADNVRGLGGSAPFSFSKTDEGRHLLIAAAVAIGSATGVRVDLTARDEHGASASAWVRVDVGVMPNAAGAPAFGAQVADQTADTGTAFSLALPAATGGDVSKSGRAINSPYTYAVSGLPAGLSFDAATRTVSGTPRASGSFTVTYTADDADSSYSLKASPGPADTADAARQTFTIQVTGPPPPPPTVPLLLSARVSSDGTKLTLYYDQELDPNSTPAHAHFSANIAGTGHSLPVDATPAQREADPVIVAGSTVTITLALDSNNAVTAGQTVAMGYKAANAAANPIKNLAGLKAGRISALAVINDVGATVPTVTGVSIISPPTHDTDTPADGTLDTYGAGAKIHIQLTYSDFVRVDTSRGRPRLKIGFGGGNHKWAVYAANGSGRQPIFIYTVVSGDTSTDGVAVVADTLELTGGSILSLLGPPASLAHIGLANNSGHKVNGALDAQPPRFVSATVDGKTLKITFDEDLDSTSRPAGGPFLLRGRHAGKSISSVFGDRLQTVGVNGKVVEVSLVHEIPASAAVTVNYEKPNANFLKDANGNAVERFSGQPVTNNTAALSDPTNLAVAAGTRSGSLTVTWEAPTTATTTAPTSYDLRYYAGSEDPPPGREADWIEDAVGLPTDTAGSAETATIEWLKANTAYRVQLRAKYAVFDGPWSASGSGTTGMPPATNNAPRVLGKLSPVPASGNICKVFTANGPVQAESTIAATGGSSVSAADMVGNLGRTNGWPKECNRDNNRLAPQFDDVDGDELKLTVSHRSLPAHVRVGPTQYFAVFQPGELTATDRGRVFFQGQAAFRDTPARAVRARVTATDPHGASVSIRLFAIVGAVQNPNGAPTLPVVPALDASPGRAVSYVLPAASGGDNFFIGPPEYYYAVSGLPEGLSFDPETRTVSGVPSETGSFDVTYIADDPDDHGSAYLNPKITNTNDVASRTFTIEVKPFIDLVRVTSAPTHDANGDGRNDTYTKGDKIVFDVEFTEPVKVDGEGADGGNVRLRLDVGPNGGGKAQRDANREVAKLTDTFHGGKTLRFTYIVEGNSLDPDGVFVQTFGNDGLVLKLNNGATIKGLVSKLDADLTRTDFITGNAVGEDGIPMTYVNGWATAAGPTPVSAKVNGKTLTVTFDEDLAALSAADLEALPLHFAVQARATTSATATPSSIPPRLGRPPTPRSWG